MKNLLLNYYDIHNKEIYFFDALDGFPGKIDVQTGEVVWISGITGERRNIGAGTQKVIYKRERFYVVGRGCKEILVLDINNKVVKSIDISREIHIDNDVAFMCDYKEQIYIFSKDLKEIISMSLEDEEINRIEFNNLDDTICYCGSLIEDNVYLLPVNGNEVFVFHLETEQFEKVHLNRNLTGIVSCVRDANHIYILNRDGEIYVWEIENKKLQDVNLNVSTVNQSGTMGKVLYAANKLIILPSLATEIKVLDLKTNIIERYSEYPDDFKYEELEGWSKYCGCCEDEDNYYLPRISNYMLIIRKDTGELQWIKLQLPPQEEKMLLAIERGKIEFSERVFQAGSGMKLTQYIGIMKKLDDNQCTKTCENGFKIWNQFKERI